VSSVSQKFRARALVLPITDESTQLPSDVLEEMTVHWSQALEQNTDLILIKPDQVQISGSNSKEISESASKAGIPLILEPKIIEIQAKGKVDPVGVIRRAQSELVIRIQLRALNSKSASESYNKVKTITIEDSQIRIGEATGSHTFVQRSPQLVKRRILESFEDYIPDVQMLLGKFAWEGRVALVQGDRIYLNVGKLTGVKVGDILKVSDIGDEIYDPQSGQFIGRTPGRVKGTIEVISYFGEDGSISVVHSGSGFKENDRVELHW
jgi:hypothetical protein